MSSTIFKSSLMIDQHKQKSSFRSPRELKNNTQKAAFSLLQKEEVNVKKNRMECLLIQQFIGKYGSKNPHSDINDFIKKTIRQFVNSYDNIIQAESMLGSLESQIKDIVATMKQTRKTKKDNEVMEARVNSRQNGNTQPIERQKSGTMPTQNIDENQWPVINAILALSDEQRNQQAERAKEARQIKFQQDLSKQISENKKKALIDREEKAVALQTNKQNLALYEHDVADMRHKKEDNFKAERTMRELQIEENKRQRERERDQRIKQEQSEMARSRRLEMEEEELKRHKREEQKRAQDLLFEENERNKAIKAEAQREKQNFETKLNRDYEAKLEREEIARANAFQARMDSLHNIANNYESRVGAKLKQDLADNERATQNALEAKEQRDAERERVKVETRKQQSLASAEYNIAMMEKKRAAKDKERMESLERRLRLEADIVEAKQKEREVAEARRNKMLEMKRNLDSQVSQKTAKGREQAGLSDIELHMNMSIIKKLNEDPAMLSRVIERVKPVPRGGGGASSTASNIFG